MIIFLRRVLIGFIALLAALVAGFLIAVSLGITVDLDPIRPASEAIASTAIGREVTIGGSFTLIPTLRPTAEIQDLRIGNPDGWDSPDFASMRLARLSVDALPLLSGRLLVHELRAEGVSVVLERKPSGEVNWLFGGGQAGGEAGAAPDEEPASAEPTPGWNLAAGEEPLLTAAEITTLALEDIEVRYVFEEIGEPIEFVLRELHGRAATDKEVRITAQGDLDDHPYTFRFATGSLEDLWNDSGEFPVEFDFEIAETKLEITGNVATGTGSLLDLVGVVVAPDPDAEPLPFASLDVVLSGERLDSLDRLAGVSLPPLGPHGIDGHFEAFMNGGFESEIKVYVGESELVGKADLELAREVPSAKIELVAETIQLNDFNVGDWSPVESEPDPDAESGASAEETLALLSPEAMRSVDIELHVRVGQVQSGADALGGATLDSNLKGGRFTLDPLVVEVPGGALRVSAGLAPSERDVTTSLRMLMERFDYGILARRVDPASDMGGLMSLDVSLDARAPDYEAMMANANGHIDFSLFPEEFEAGIFDLWAVNLMSAVLPKLDSEESSKINCIVGLFNIDAGLLEDEAILVDTSKMSAGGHAQVDFNTGAVEVRLKPSGKKPEFFALATPVYVKGNIADFEYGVHPEDLFGSVILFTTSPIHVPIRRMFGAKVPPDGAEACLAASNRDTAPRKSPFDFLK